MRLFLSSVWIPHQCYSNLCSWGASAAAVVVLQACPAPLQGWFCGLCHSQRKRVEAAGVPLNYWCSCFSVVKSWRNLWFESYFTLLLEGYNSEYSKLLEKDQVCVADARSWSLKFHSEFRVNMEPGTKILHLTNRWRSFFTSVMEYLTEVLCFLIF